jgi:hypothetical protein
MIRSKRWENEVVFWYKSELKNFLSKKFNFGWIQLPTNFENSGQTVN